MPYTLNPFTGALDYFVTGAGHDAVTLAGTLDYLTLSGQEITRGPIDLATDVTGVLPDANVSNTITLDNLTQITTRDHGSLTGLTDDDHSVYALLAGRAGGQTLIGGTASGEDLRLQSTAHATRGHVEIEDLMKVGTSTHAFGATTDYYIDLATSGAATVTTGGITGMRFAPTVTVSGNTATTIMALFNDQATIKDDGTARTLGPALIFASQNTYTATVAGGLTVNDLVGIPTYTGLYWTLTTNRTGAGTGTLTTAAGVYISNQSNIGVGWTVTNYIGMLIDAPTVGGTLTNLYGIKNNVNSATNRWFLYSGGTAQNYLAGALGIGQTTPTAGLHLWAGTAAANTAPLKFASGTSLTAAEAGAVEYDGTAMYETVSTTNGRTQSSGQNVFRLTANGAAIGPAIADYFGSNSAIPTVTNGIYEITFYIRYLKTTAGTVTYTITNTQTYTNIVATYIQSAVGGMATNAATTGAGIVTTTAAAAALPATASLTTGVNHFAIIRCVAECGTAGNIRLRVTESAGTVTPLRGSYYTVRRLFAGNVGTFAA